MQRTGSLSPLNRSVRRARRRMGNAACTVAEHLERRVLLTTWYVGITNAADNSTHGSSTTAPFATIQYALSHSSASGFAASAAGDDVRVLPGVYREDILVPYYSSTTTTTIEADTPGTATIEGADPVTGWSSYTASPQPAAGGAVFRISGYENSSHPNPQEVIYAGTWLQEIGAETGSSGAFVDINTGFDGNPMRVTVGAGIADMVPNSFYFDTTNNILYMDLPTGTTQTAVNAADVEVSTREQWLHSAFSGSAPAHNYLIKNLNFIYTNGGNQTYGYGLAMPDSSTVQNCSVEYGGFGGISVQTYTTSSASTISNCTIAYNGDVGIASAGHNSGFSFFGNTIEYNNFRHFDVEWEAGGIKLITSGSYGGYEEGNIYNNQIAYNYGCGFWIDTSANGPDDSGGPGKSLNFYGNYVHDNSAVSTDYWPGYTTSGEGGIKVEVSSYVNVYNNVVTNNFPNGILLSSSAHVNVYNNTLVGNRGVAAIDGFTGGRSVSGHPEPLEYDNVENNILYDNYSEYDLLFLQNGALNTSQASPYPNSTDNNMVDYNLYYRFGGPLQLSNGDDGAYTTSSGSTSYRNALGPMYTDLASWVAATSTDGWDTHSISGSPNFLVPGSTTRYTGDTYALGSNSPARGVGAVLDLDGNGVTTNDTDYTGTVRGALFDMGAFEYVSGGVGTTDVPVSTDPLAWVDDALPAGAVPMSGKLGYNVQDWNWVSASTPSNAPFATVPSPAESSGALSMIPSAIASADGGLIQMTFEGATQQLTVNSSDHFGATVYVDPAAIPSEIMMQFHINGTWYRAYWGSDKITSFSSDFESDDTGTIRVHIGNIPASGGWMRLSITESQLSIPVGTIHIDGLSLDNYAGQVLWDDIGLNTATAVNPISTWSLNEGSGTIAHDSVGSNNATLVGNQNWRPTGVSGGDFYFDGNGTYFDAGSSSTLNLGTTAGSTMSIAGWFDLSPSASTEAIGVDKHGSYRLVAFNDTSNHSASAYQFFVTDSSGALHTCQSTALYPNNQWHYVVGTYDGAGDMTLYVDGQVAATTTWSGTYTLGLNTNEFDIGRRDLIARYFQGQLDEISLYNQVLSAANVISNYIGYGGTPGLWINGSGGDWQQTPNWSAGAIPNGIGDEADFYGAISAAQTVTTGLADTLGTIRFNNTNPYTLGGAGTITLQTSTGSALVDVEAGTQTIQVPFTVAGNATFYVAPGATLIFAGPFTVNSGETLSISGGGTILYQSSINVMSGASMTIGNTVVATSLTLATGATVTMSPSIGNAKNVLQVNTLTFGGSSNNWQGTLDLWNNDLIVKSGNLSTLTNQIKSGFNSGHGYWNGTGIRSSAAAEDVKMLTALGITPNTANGHALYSTFDGQGVISTDILVRYTYYGDTNLDESVDGTDYSQIDTAYHNPSLSGWSNGDFNYDGSIDGSDYSLIDNDFNQSGAVTLNSMTTEIPSAAASSEIALSLMSTGKGHQAPPTHGAGAVFNSISAIAPSGVGMSIASNTEDIIDDLLRRRGH
jgi:parallel beta-helix repeat protein